MLPSASKAKACPHAVSYTHLDVYKRQFVTHAYRMAFRFLDFSQDVYKRQVCKDAPTFQADPKWQIIFETFPHAKVRPPIPQYPQISDQIQTMIQDVLTGKATAENALKKAEEEVNKILTQ